MVQLAPVFSLSSLFVLATGTPLIKRDMATIQADITNISSLLVTWDNDVNAFSGTTDGANAIHADSVALESAFQTATTDTQATTNFTTDMNALLVLGQMENSSTILVGGLTQIAEKSANFTSINGTATILSDLSSLGAAATGFIAAISDIITDPEVVAQATQFETTWSAAFGDAISDIQTGL
ncbi:hydrophobic surface binding protein A-domain-containing protein [Lentinula aff. detonsa]|uniref:Hydrophobic surface binding protein A-domain-containing protein n=2 Tax=Lentinula TaxID=5352 RepID=A0AA38KPH5_9AGAR|nr:hydrophobic surface binding protein A-domain-containing protein [Lentinula aff. detonsa]